MARTISAVDYYNATTAYLSANQGPFTVLVRYFKPADLTGSAGYVLYSGSGVGNHWAVRWESVSNAVDFYASGYTGTNPATSSSITLDASDVASGCAVAWRYKGQSNEWSKWKATGDGGRATVTKTVISSSISFTLPTLSTANTGIGDGTLSVDGDVAEISIILYDMSDEQMQALMRGVCADQVTTPTAYWPLRGTLTAEPNYANLPAWTGTGTLTATGAPVAAAHPATYGLDDIRSPSQLHAWALDIYHSSGTILAASSALSEIRDADVLGAPYPRRITNGDDIEIARAIDDGIGTLKSTPTVILANPKRLGLCTTYASAVFDDEPLAYWRLGDPATTLSGVTNTTLRDSTANGYHAAINGTLTLGATGALSGDSDTAITCNGTSTNYGLVPSGATALSSLTSAMTVECWFKAAASTGSYGLIDNATSGASNKHFALFTSGSTIYARFLVGGVQKDATYATGGLSTSSYTHVVATFDGANVRLYTNGTLRATTSAAGSLDTGTFQTYLGRLGDSAYTLSGSLDEVAVYSYALSATQVSRHYTIGSSGARDWRGVPFRLRRYERSSHECVTELAGVIADTDFGRPGRVAFTLIDRDDSVLSTLIPRRIVNVDEHPVGDTVTDVGAPIPAVFGHAIYTAPFIGEDATSNPGGAFFVVGHIEDASGTAQSLRVRDVFYDVYSGVAEKDRAGSWVTAPGSVSYYATDKFAVTSSGDGKYEVGMPVRFKTTASPSTYVYSYITAYDSVNYRVTVADSVLDAGLTSVQINSGWLVDVSSYTSNGQPLMCIQTIGAVPDAGVVIDANNATYGNPADVVREILVNSEWGLGETVDESLFDTAATDFTTAAAAFATACDYALGGEKQQRQARTVLRELLSMRGAWIDYDGQTSRWRIYVDKAAPSTWRSFGYVDGYYNNIRSVAYERTTPLGDMIRSVNLRYAPTGRVKSTTDGIVVFEGANDYLYSLYGVAQGSGNPLIVTNPWIRKYAVAKEVAAYLGKRLKYEDVGKGLVCGYQARNVQLGEPINAKLAPSGFTGTLRVVGFRRRLGETMLECVGYNSALYSTATAADLDYEDGTGSNTTTDSANSVAAKDYDPRVGLNFWRNGGLAIGPRKSSSTIANDAGALPGFVINNGDVKTISISSTGSSGTIGQSYLTVSVSSGAGSLSPYIRPNAGLDNSYNVRVMPMKRYDVGIFSWYSDIDTSLVPTIHTFDNAGNQLELIIPTLRTDAATNSLGWPRRYVLFRATDADTAYARCSIGFNAASTTYKFDAFQAEIAKRGLTKPSAWSPGIGEDQLVLTKKETLSLSAGATKATDSTNKILEAGMMVLDVSYIVSPALGGATSFDIGPTGGTANLFGDNIAVTSGTTGKASVNGASFTPQVITTDNTITLTANGSNFTATGTVTIYVHYYKVPIPTT